IELFHRPEASGAPDTIFNESVDRVDSKYVAIHDDDDSWHPEFLERTVAVLDAGAKGVVTKTDRVYEKLVGNRIETTKKKPYLNDMRLVSLHRQCFENQLTPIAFIFERETYEKIGK